MVYKYSSYLLVISFFILMNTTQAQLKINEQGYYEVPGLNIMVFDDFYPEGHQGGVSIIQHGTRVAANGDLRLEPTPGQWSPVPYLIDRKINKENNIVTAELAFPDSTKDRKGFNPIIYPDLKFKYIIRTEPAGNGIKVIVDLEKPLPAEWEDNIGFNLELFPGSYFGEPYLMDNKSGIFPQQANGPMYKDNEGNLQVTPLAEGKQLIVCPGDKLKEIKFVSTQTQIQLIDGRALHNNGWFIIRSSVQPGAVKNAVEWIITPSVDTTWRYKPVIQISQVGYHPKQNKFAVMELDKLTENFESIQLLKITEGKAAVIRETKDPQPWGKFLRYKYIRFDFSDIAEEGLYKIKYGDIESHVFEIKNDIYSRHIWQPTLETFLPVQMCHMRVEDRYKVWHGICHMDDALMAPVNHIHFDGYKQGESTLTNYQPGEHVPGINIGGWHDAGDYDLRVESQIETVYRLTQAYEFFKNDYDQTTIDQENRVAILHKPDGKPDILQQIEHGVLSIIGGYESLGRLFRGIICSDLKQYVHLGDAATMTDNLVYEENKNDPVLDKPLPKDDRLVFTEINPQRELYVAQGLAAASRVLKEYNSTLSDKCLVAAKELYKNNTSAKLQFKINAAAELYLSTSEKEYEELITGNANMITENILFVSDVIGRVTKKINNKEFTAQVEKAVKDTYNKITEQQKENPYGVPYRPYIWGAGWGIQSFGVKQLFLHLGFPGLFSNDYVFNALNFVLGCHPGENNASFVSGVGVNSLLVAYGVNRDEWSYIPGGVGSGTALIRPDFPELKVWPYFWQQTEYVMGGGTVDFMILAMAADKLLNL